MLNKDLYEKYLQKKAKKLGVSVEELKSDTTTSSSDFQTTSSLTNTSSATSYSTSATNVNTSYTCSQSTQVNQQPTIIDKRENKFAVIGYPLGHSLSGVIHSAGFKSINLDAKYDILETKPEDLVERIKMLKNENYKGFNVTIPLKLPIALFVEEVDKSADIASAINTVLINPDRTLKGYNTDIMGFKRAIPVDYNLKGKVAGILGTGGASRAATVALAEGGVKEIRFYTRNIPDSLDLLKYMRRIYPDIKFGAFSIEFIRDLSMVDILVNATPIGMASYSADLTPVEKPQLATLPETALVYDVIYNPKETVLIRLAKQLGYRTVNGVDMLIGQAVEAEKIWTGSLPNSDTMKIQLLNAL